LDKRRRSNAHILGSRHRGKKTSDGDAGTCSLGHCHRPHEESLAPRQERPVPTVCHLHTTHDKPSTSHAFTNTSRLLSRILPALPVAMHCARMLGPLRICFSVQCIEERTSKSHGRDQNDVINVQSLKADVAQPPLLLCLGDEDDTSGSSRQTTMPLRTKTNSPKA
jgi:hypothetical protein